MAAALRRLLDPRTPLSRGRYAALGFGLMILKYAVDALVIRAVTGVAWTPLDYLSPLGGERLDKLRTHEWLVWSLVAWTLPFVWIGVTLTVRRVVDARLSPWLALGFFAPVLNYALMLALCLVPSRARDEWELDDGEELAERAHGVFLPILAGLAAGVPTFLVSVYLLENYGASLFLGTPFLMGCVTAYLYGRRGGDFGPAAFGLPALTVLAACGLVLLFALEGVVCIAMAAPLWIGLAILGGLLGYGISNLRSSPAAPALIALVGLPGISTVERAWTAPAPLTVVTTVEIDLPPERVWPHLISFPELPPPTELIFRAGIAYPTHATIEGTGVGALRRCEFSTGAFVEPITVWDAPRQLAFDVVEQPDPLRELHPWAQVRPPHLESGWRSLRGEFRLEPLPGDRTLLVGTTWCELSYAPVPYWRPWAEGILHRIHGRVLRHVKALAEAR